jgi:hypothetical protein
MGLVSRRSGFIPRDNYRMEEKILKIADVQMTANLAKKTESLDSAERSISDVADSGAMGIISDYSAI